MRSLAFYDSMKNHIGICISLDCFRSYSYYERKNIKYLYHIKGATKINYNWRK